MATARTTSLTATHVSAQVRSGELDPTRVTAAALDRISRDSRSASYFRRVRYHEALREAAALKQRSDLRDLCLAGVPIAVKEVAAVTGEMPPPGAPEGQQPYRCDSDVVARLRAAGAVIVGTTRTPQWCLWPMTDDASAIVTNPWAQAYTAGGSSGGSAAAVAAGLVPLAHGTDAFGSVRSPAAVCGVVGITPGTGTVPAADSSYWSGLYTHGPLATTVADAALMLSVLAERPALAHVSELSGALRIAVSLQAPGVVRPIPRQFATAVMRSADLLNRVGHDVVSATPEFGHLSMAQFTRWLAGPVSPDDIGVCFGLEPRTRGHLCAARFVRRANLIRERPRERWVARAESFFTRHDVLITPMLATLPPPARRWSARGWFANALPAIQLTPFLGPWDLAGFPTLTVPVAQEGPAGPIGLQMVAPPGAESRLLALAAQLEKLNPWPRTAPPQSDGSVAGYPPS